jgi:hypothetical protein
MGYNQSVTVTLQVKYDLQKGRDNKQTSISTAIDFSDILLENETEDKEKPQNVGDIYTERANFKINNSDLRNSKKSKYGNSVSSIILYCKFRI